MATHNDTHLADKRGQPQRLRSLSSQHRTMAVVVVACPIKGSITCCGIINKNKNMTTHGELSEREETKNIIQSRQWLAGWARDELRSRRRRRLDAEKKNVKTEKIMCYAPDVRSQTDFGFGAVLWHPSHHQSSRCRAGQAGSQPVKQPLPQSILNFPALTLRRRSSRRRWSGRSKDQMLNA